MAEVEASENKIESTVNGEKSADNGTITEKKDEKGQNIENLSTFVIRRVLRNNIMQKQIALEGKFPGCTDTALVVLEKKSFPNSHLVLKEDFFNDAAITEGNWQNDIYRTYDIVPKCEYSLSATVTYPATGKHIEKFLPPKYYLIDETPEMYHSITLPSIQAQKFSLQWVHNILDGTAETERVIFRDDNESTGFVLVKDIKWNDELSTLYLIAIAKQKIMSIRDLKVEHLPLLRNIRDAGTKAISEKYNIPAHQLRIFFHYQPSYYQLHVHFVAFDVENAGSSVDRAHLLSTVIANIELMPNYYQEATLTFRVAKYPLYKPYENYLNNRNAPQVVKRPGSAEKEKQRPSKRSRFSM